GRAMNRDGVEPRRSVLRTQTTWRVRITSPRSGRRRVAQGKSAQPWVGRAVRESSPRSGRQRPSIERRFYLQASPSPAARLRQTKAPRSSESTAARPVHPGRSPPIHLSRGLQNSSVSILLSRHEDTKSPGITKRLVRLSVFEPLWPNAQNHYAESTRPPPRHQ